MGLLPNNSGNNSNNNSTISGVRYNSKRETPGLTRRSRGTLWRQQRSKNPNTKSKLYIKKHANFHIAPPEELISVTSPWPFAKRGLDLLRLFPQGLGQVKFLIVGVFIKWIEAEPLANATAQRSQKFLYRNIITGTNSHP